jgi:hypothetical protein
VFFFGQRRGFDDYDNDRRWGNDGGATDSHGNLPLPLLLFLFFQQVFLPV